MNRDINTTKTPVFSFCCYVHTEKCQDVHNANNTTNRSSYVVISPVRSRPKVPRKGNNEGAQRKSKKFSDFNSCMKAEKNTINRF